MNIRLLPKLTVEVVVTGSQVVPPRRSSPCKGTSAPPLPSLLVCQWAERDHEATQELPVRRLGYQEA